MNSRKWLDKNRIKDIKDRFTQATPATEQLPTLEFTEGIPVFLRTVEDSRDIGSQYGPREIVDIEIIEPATVEENPPGTKLTLWLTQEVIKSKVKNFRNEKGRLPGGLELCVVALGRRTGAKKFKYNDYWIGTPEQAKEILGDLM